MKKVFLFLLILSACDKVYDSETMTEAAVVDDVVATPRTHGDSVGMSMKGTLVVGGVDTAARYAVVFVCQHERFMVQGGEDSKAFAFWSKAKKGSKVKLTYTERYKIDDGKRIPAGFHLLNVEEAQ